MKRHLKNHFIPHEGNDHVPHSLREHTVIIMLLIAMMLYLLPPVWKSLTVGTKTYAIIAPLVIIDYTNAERVSNNLKPLKLSDELTLSSKLKSEDMASKQYFAHDAPDGTFPWKFFDDAKYDYKYGGENLAINFSESSDVVKGWMMSPTHKENMLDSRFQDIGVSFTHGVYKGRETDYIVQHLGTKVANALGVEGKDTLTNIPSELVTINGRQVEYKRLKEPVTLTLEQVRSESTLDKLVATQNNNSQDSIANNNPPAIVPIKVEKKKEIVPYQSVQDKAVTKEVAGLTADMNATDTASNTKSEDKYSVVTSIQELSNKDLGSLANNPGLSLRVDNSYSSLSDRFFIFPENISKIALTFLMIYSIVSLLFLFITEIKHHHVKHMGYGFMLILIMIVTHMSL